MLGTVLRRPFPTAPPTAPTPDATTIVVNARVGYAFTKRVRAQIDVFNLLNSNAHEIDYFYRSRLPGEPSEGVSDVHFHPVESRAVRATMTFTF